MDVTSEVAASRVGVALAILDRALAGDPTPERLAAAVRTARRALTGAGVRAPGVRRGGPRG